MSSVVRFVTVPGSLGCAYTGTQPGMLLVGLITYESDNPLRSGINPFKVKQAVGEHPAITVSRLQLNEKFWPNKFSDKKNKQPITAICLNSFSLIKSSVVCLKKWLQSGQQGN